MASYLRDHRELSPADLKHPGLTYYLFLLSSRISSALEASLDDNNMADLEADICLVAHSRAVADMAYGALAGNLSCVAADDAGGAVVDAGSFPDDSSGQEPGNS